MTSLTLNTPAANNAMLSMPSISSIGKKISNNKIILNYLSAPKSLYKKATARFIRIDWDANMNELEFE